jgi:IMP dehydrogenase
MENEPLALTYDDVLLVPRRSRVRSRKEVSTRSRLTPGIELDVPLVSANMDTVTTAPMAIAMARLGGIGIIHRFLSVEDQAAEVRKVKRFLTDVVVDPYTISPNKTLGEARAEAKRLGVTGLLVTGPEHRLLGILTARDMRAGTDAERITALMTPAERLVTARPGIDLDQARKLLHEHRIEKLPMVDEEGVLAGLITLRDLTLREQYPGATRDGQGRLRVGAAVGVRGGCLPRAEAVIAAGADVLVLDVAHGHADHALDTTRDLKASWPETELIAGNVGTAEGFRDLVAAGADTVKVGIGPGLACTTRAVAGVGVPQLTAILDCAQVARETAAPLVADGGIRRPADVAKAVAAGASTVMVGSLFAGRVESPGEVVRRRGQLYKVYRGMASRSAFAARLRVEERGDALDQYVPEGEEMEFRLAGPVAEVANELVGGLRSGMSYVDATTIPEFWEKARFVRQTEAAKGEGATDR